jgi:hypothetical protein
MVESYAYSPICLHGIVVNYLSTETVLTNLTPLLLRIYCKQAEKIKVMFSLFIIKHPCPRESRDGRAGRGGGWCEIAAIL